ncbi:MAG TPA: hypothetical protein VFT79_04830 [Solirubrobacterales bacterium]|nr:hypothetical protein [Solirubrobacterales bacterium]
MIVQIKIRLSLLLIALVAGPTAVGTLGFGGHFVNNYSVSLHIKFVMEDCRPAK